MPQPPPDRPTERVRGRRLGERERTEQILRATLAVVAERGFDQATLARIADRAGISKGLVSHYFRDRDDLMEQAVRVAVATVRDRVAAEIDLTAPVPEVMRAAIRHVAQVVETLGGESTAVREIVGHLRRPDGTHRVDLSTLEDTYQAQERLFRRGQEEGSLRAFDTRVMAATYQGAMDTMLGYAAAYPGTDIDAYAGALADLLVAAVVRT